MQRRARLTTVRAHLQSTDGTPKNEPLHGCFTPVEQVVTSYRHDGVEYDAKAQVNVPATATITGKTDALNTAATGATVKVVTELHIHGDGCDWS